MAAPYSDLANKCEAALKSATASLVSGATELTGTDDDTKASPQVISIADSVGDEEPLYTGNFRVPCRVTIVNQVDDVSLATHRANVAAVADALRTDTLAATLSAAVTDFYVLAVKHLGEETSNTETQFRTSILLELYACATDL